MASAKADGKTQHNFIYTCIYIYIYVCIYIFFLMIRDSAQ